ncbi:MAG: UDP-N-acetylmuramoyl-L-alanine--D-glutamate ligase [Actinomycetota bacterium]|nr:UDP-N-acetylmuramoyl-L-alanine--D-glutamate ligase [Actinomycetota bacterium]
MITKLGRESDWSKYHVVVAGIGVAGYACADALMQLGARVSVVDNGAGPKQQERAEILRTLEAEVLLGYTGEVPSCDLLVVSPGLRPSNQLITGAIATGIPVWGELELAWRLRPTIAPAPWLVITGTNGKTTATMMLESMLRAGGLNAVSAGNIGTSLVDVVMHDSYEVIAVEVGAPQLPFVHTISPHSAVCLNIADDHLDHFGSKAAYVAAKAKIFERTQVAAVYNADDEATRVLVEDADVVAGCRAIGFTLGVPGLSMLGVVDGALVDRAFIENRQDAAQELALASEVQPNAPHNVANALAAAALARAFEVRAPAISAGLRAFEPAAHRIAQVATVAGVNFVDDSKATNTHAAQTSLLAYPRVVWLAGGMAKGQDFDDLVRQVRAHLRAVIVIGVDQAVIAESVSRHAPDVPVLSMDRTDTGVMREVVEAAMGFAKPGDTVLLAPGCASWDMFTDYGHRGTTFADAVREFAATRSGDGV